MTPLAYFDFTKGTIMRIKLPENFGGLSIDGAEVKLKPDADGCVEAPDGVAQALLSHGGVIAPDVEERNSEVESELEGHDKQRELIAAKRQKGGK